MAGRLPISEIITKAGLLTNFGDEAGKLADLGRIERQVCQGEILYAKS